MLAALTNALRVVGKRLEDVRVVVSGAGAAGTAIMKLLLRQGVGDIIAYDRKGALHRGMAGAHPDLAVAGREHQQGRTTRATWPARSSARTSSSG